MNSKKYLLSALVCLLLGVVACGDIQEKQKRQTETVRYSGSVEYKIVNIDSIIGLKNLDDLRKSLAVLERSCRVVGKPNYGLGIYGFLSGVDQVGEMSEPCDNLKQIDTNSVENMITYLKDHFVALQVLSVDDEDSLLTGYYEASLNASRYPSDKYRYPIYAVPSDLVRVDINSFRYGLPSQTIFGRVIDDTLHPYYSRKEISTRGLLDKAQVILWADDILDVYILHIQGSGVAHIEDGTLVNLSYAANNGRGYISVARDLINRGLLKRGRASWQDIRGLLENYQNNESEILGINPRYIFFEESSEQGSRGTLGTSLVAEYSLAVDPRYVPLGVPVWVESEGIGSDGEGLKRLMVSQDTGAAIKGALRGDFFWGSGEYAAKNAEMTYSKVKFTMFVPKSILSRIKNPVQ